MRDPLRPIPSPSAVRRYWEQAAPPPPPARRSEGARPAYDPGRILRDHERDTLGLDRRASRREYPNQPAAPTHDNQALLRAGHESLQGVLGLCTVHGWALVETLSLCPQGVLLRHIDAAQRDLSCETRVELGRTLAALSPVMGAPLRRGKLWEDTRGRSSSPLANVGTHLLGARVVADASNWANADARRGTRASSNLQVTLVLPPRGRQAVRGLAQLARVEGSLNALNDPDPRVLGVGLDGRAVQELRWHLQGARRTPARR